MFPTKQQPASSPSTHCTKVVATIWAAWGSLAPAALAHSEGLTSMKPIPLGAVLLELE